MVGSLYTWILLWASAWENINIATFRCGSFFNCFQPFKAKFALKIETKGFMNSRPALLPPIVFILEEHLYLN